MTADSDSHCVIAAPMLKCLHILVLEDITERVRLNETAFLNKGDFHKRAKYTRNPSNSDLPTENVFLNEGDFHKGAKYT